MSTLGDDTSTKSGSQSELEKEETKQIEEQVGCLEENEMIVKNFSSRKRPKRHKPGFHLEMFKETSYYFQGGMRFVYPYPFTFTAHVKGRWLKMSILELFSKEFHMETMDYYKKAIYDGKIRVNGKPVSFDTILSNNDILETSVHRHEPPVVNEAIEFLQNDKEMVVINKPPSIPVHPCGRYRHNTVVFILGKEYGLHGLHTIHRLDRLTSGVLMFARTIEKSKEMEHQIHREVGSFKKEYLARVVGEFPDEEITVDEPIITASHKIGVCHVNKNGKTCSTVFKRLSYNGKSSVVSCKPHQGRMHQIRVHLQWLRHPIVNDPIYNHPTAWVATEGEERYDMDVAVRELLCTRKDKSYDEELSTDKPNSISIESITTDDKSNKDDNDDSPNVKKRKLDRCDEEHKKSETDDSESNSCASDQTTINSNCHSENLGNISENIIERIYDKNTSFMSRDIGEQYVDDDCTDCKRVWKKPLLSEMVMYLHSLHYKGPNWEYRTSVPKWASEDWMED